LRIERSGQSDAQGKRKYDADIAYQHHRGTLFQDAFEINFKTYDKHEEQKPKLTQGRKRRQG